MRGKASICDLEVSGTPKKRPASTERQWRRSRSCSEDLNPVVNLFNTGDLGNNGLGNLLQVVGGDTPSEFQAAIAEAVQLTDEESKIFWPLYNEYTAKVNKIHDHRVGLIKSYANHFDKMTNEKADAIWLEALNIEQDLLKLQKTYYKKFKKVMPAARAARYFQAENKIETLIDAQLALEIPLIEKTK